MKNKKLWSWLFLLLGFLIIFGTSIYTLNTKSMMISQTFNAIINIFAGVFVITGLIIKASG